MPVTSAYDGLFAQDQWTRSRMTLNAGVRLDILNASIPAQSYPDTPFVAARSFPAVNNAPNWKDINPADWRGLRSVRQWHHRTEGQHRPIRPGGDHRVRRQRQPDRHLGEPGQSVVDRSERQRRARLRLQEPAAQLRVRQGQQPNFGGSGPATTYDPNLLDGWGQRPFDWEFQTGIQQQFRQGVSLNVTYTRHWWGNFLVNDDRNTSPSDYTPYCVTAPLDSRLPGGGGNQLCGFYDINPDKFGNVDNFVTYSKNYGEQSDIYNGVDVSVATRLPRGVLLQGGFNTGHEVWDNCGVVGSVDNTASALATDIARAGVNTPT